MRRKLRNLKQILDYQLGQQRLFAKVELKGPILNVLLERLPHDEIDEKRLTQTIRSAMDAAAIHGIRKVNIFVWIREKNSPEPEWSTSFSYQMLPSPTNEKRPHQFRKDYPNIRILFFCLGIGLGLWFIFDNRPWFYWITPALALVLGATFPWLKRQINRWVDPSLQRIALGLGILGILVVSYLLWQTQALLYVPLMLIGLLLIGFGLW